jgi:hypothetical protein
MELELFGTFAADHDHDCPQCPVRNPRMTTARSTFEISAILLIKDSAAGLRNRGQYDASPKKGFFAQISDERSDG